MRPDTVPPFPADPACRLSEALMSRFRRVYAAAVLLALLLAATPAPAAASPWTTGLEDGGMHLQWRLMSWVMRHFNPGRGITNATAADGSKIVP